MKIFNTGMDEIKIFTSEKIATISVKIKESFLFAGIKSIINTINSRHHNHSSVIIPTSNSRSNHLEHNDENEINVTIHDNSSQAPVQLPVYDALALAGGGAQGLSYAGVIEVLGPRLADIKEVAGSSAGAITVVMIALGLDSKQLDNEFTSQKPVFNQEKLANSIKDVIKRALEPYQKEIAATLKLSETEEQTFTSAVKKNDSEKTDTEATGRTDNSKYDNSNFLEEITFEQLELIRDKHPEIGIKKLYITAALYEKKNKMTGEVLLSSDTTPKIPIYKAALASSALPVFLPMVTMANKDFFNGAIYGADNPEKKIHLRDGGIHNNVPHMYLKGEKKLILSFSGTKNIHLRKLNIMERIKNIFARENVYGHRQADIKVANDNYNVHYIDPKVSEKNKIGATDMKKAVKFIDAVRDNAAREFRKYEEDRSHYGDTKHPKNHDVMNHTLNELKYK